MVLMTFPGDACTCQQDVHIQSSTRIYRNKKQKLPPHCPDSGHAPLGALPAAFRRRLCQRREELARAAGSWAPCADSGARGPERSGASAPQEAARPGRAPRTRPWGPRARSPDAEDHSPDTCPRAAHRARRPAVRVPSSRCRPDQGAAGGPGQEPGARDPSAAGVRSSRLHRRPRFADGTVPQSLGTPRAPQPPVSPRVSDAGSGAERTGTLTRPHHGEAG